MWSLAPATISTPLPLLGPHLPVLAASTAGFFAIQRISSKVSSAWLGSKWDAMDQRTRTSWNSHVVSMVHACLIVPLAMACLASPILKRDPVFGYDPMVGHVLALTSGYFIWDTIDSAFNSTAGFVIHGVACFAVFIFSFRPFLAGFGPPFLLWELSTPFLNIHWFMDKLSLSQTYPTLHLINALVFMLVFFLARIVYGSLNSFWFFRAMWEERSRIPLHLYLIYCGGNLALNALNWLWFSKMLAKMVDRLSGGENDAGEKEPLKGRREKGKRKSDEVSVKEKQETKGEVEGEGQETIVDPAKAPRPIKEEVSIDGP